MNATLNVSDSRPFEPFDRRGFEDRGATPSVDELLDEFESRRRESLEYLRELNLTADQLSLVGMHPELGLVTLGQLIATWVVHDLNHLGQIARVMSMRYAEPVGPWKPYLGILSR